MDSSVALLTQLVSLSQQGGVVIEGAHAAFAATAQLGLLAAAVRQQSAASELADEIGTRAKSLLGSKQVGGHGRAVGDGVLLLTVQFSPLAVVADISLLPIDTAGGGQEAGVASAARSGL